MPVNSGDGVYTYDTFGRWSSKTVDNVTTYFLYDGADVLAEYIYVDSAYVLQATYLTPFLDENLAVYNL